MTTHVLVTGPPGSGKSYLAALAREQGMAAFDADAISNLHGWFHHAGAPVTFTDAADAAFFDEHRFLWKRPVLERFLANHPGAILFGTAANADAMRDLFDRAYFLRVSPETLRARLVHPSRDNPMGATGEQQRIILDAARADLESARALGLTILDGEASAADILAAITSG